METIEGRITTAISFAKTIEPTAEIIEVLKLVYDFKA